MMSEPTPSHEAERGKDVAALRHSLRQGTPNRSDGGVDAQVRRYANRLRRRLWQMAASSKAHADLLFSFPAACVAIVTPRGSRAAREHARQLVGNGAPLAEIADVLGLPMWLRRLPPEAFDKPLPRTIGEPAGDAAFGRHVLNLLPAAGAGASSWLQWVLEARDACDDEFALWVASQRIFEGKQILPRLMLPLALFAWFSKPHNLRATEVVAQPWTSSMGLAKAAWEAHLWLLRVLQDLCVEQENTWAKAHDVNGFTFVPLTTSTLLREEAVHMRNCLGRYGEHVVYGTCRLYSIRYDGNRLADMEVRPIEGSALPVITHLLGPGNTKPVSKAVQDAATAWLALQSRQPWPLRWGTLSDETFQRFVWQPYASTRMQGAIAEGPSPPPISRVLRDTVNLYTMAEKDRAAGGNSLLRRLAVGSRP